MTKKLEELLNIPPAYDTPQEDLAEVQRVIEENRDTIATIDETIDKIDAALPTVRDLEAADSEMDELAKMAQDKFEDLMDLGMQVEARFSGTIFQTAGVLLGHAITAKQAKLDKKLKMVDLQLKKMNLDRQIAKDAAAAAKAAESGSDGESTIDGQGVVMDRNALLAEILGKKPDGDNQ